ncbi:MAG: GDP-L-fucose synthase [Thermoanaerobaculia bacterium]|jgi:GDP-L-fucose synthase|nr:GDP-L-fucose synthase [Thermoanaerobaculia bacterium]
MSGFWPGRRVLLTGGGGFLGTFIRQRLEREQPAAILAPRKQELDLRDAAAVRAYLAAQKPDIIIHAAAVVGGIGANQKHPGSFFYENAIMGIQLIEEARLAGVAKFVCLGTICAYPKFAPIPFREDDLWNGYPEETNAAYGIAKKALLVQLQAYRQEYGFNGIFLLPVNLYGPGDNFDLESSHVIPAMIRKFVDAKELRRPTVTLWGDGTPTREFLYAADAADGIVAAASRYDGADPVNLGSGKEISIKDLAETIRHLVGYEGNVEWDSTKPNGQPNRRLDVSRAAREFGFQSQTSFAGGLAATIEWFNGHRNQQRGSDEVSQ